MTVSAGEITAEMLSKAVKHHLPDYPLPVLRIARLAVDKHYQGLGLGKKLLSYSFQLALEMKARYGCVGVVVDAKAESVVFYQKLGFISLLALSGELGDRPAPQLMFIALRTIEKAVASVALKMLNKKIIVTIQRIIPFKIIEFSKRQFRLINKILGYSIS